MTEGKDPVSDAIAALRARGHAVESRDTHPPTWVVNGDVLTDWEVVMLALDQGLTDRQGRLQ